MNPKANHHRLEQLLEDPHIWRASDAAREQACAEQTLQPVATGFSALNAELPEGGWPGQGLMELLCPYWGTGEIPLLSPAMAQLSQQGRWRVWVSPPWQPYAPGLIHSGIQTEQIIIVRSRSDRDALWAMEECLQSGQCSAVLGWPRNILPQQLKRLHLAAQKGDSLCIMMREEKHAQQPSPAPLRIQLGPLQQGLSLRILKRRGSWASDWLRLPLPECLAVLEPVAGREHPHAIDQTTAPPKAAPLPEASSTTAPRPLPAMPSLPPAKATALAHSRFSLLTRFTH